MSSAIEPVEVEVTPQEDQPQQEVPEVEHVVSGSEKVGVLACVAMQFSITLILLYCGIVQGYTPIAVNDDDFKIDRAAAAAKVVTPDYEAGCWNGSVSGCGGRIAVAILYFVIMLPCLIFSIRSFKLALEGFGVIAKTKVVRGGIARSGTLTGRSLRGVSLSDMPCGQRLSIMSGLLISYFERFSFVLFWMDVSLQIVQGVDTYSKTSAWTFCLQVFLVSFDAATWTLSFCWDNVFAATLTEAVADVAFLVVLICSSGSLSPHSLVDPSAFAFILSVVPASSVFLLGGCVSELLKPKNKRMKAGEPNQRKRMGGVVVAVLTVCVGIAGIIVGISKGSDFDKCKDGSAWEPKLVEGMECLESSFNLWESMGCDCRAMNINTFRMNNCIVGNDAALSTPFLNPEVRPRLDALMYLNVMPWPGAYRFGFQDKRESCKISEEMASSMGELTELRVLNVGGGTLQSKALPASWSKLTQVYSVTLESAQVSTIDANVTSTWTKLTNFQCLGCEYLSEVPEGMATLPEFKEGMLAGSCLCGGSCQTFLSMQSSGSGHGVMTGAHAFHMTNLMGGPGASAASEKAAEEAAAAIKAPFTCGEAALCIELQSISVLPHMLPQAFSNVKTQLQTGITTCADTCSDAKREWDLLFVYQDFAKEHSGNSSGKWTINWPEEFSPQQRSAWACAAKAIAEAGQRASFDRSIANGPRLLKEEFMIVNSGISTCEQCPWFNIEFDATVQQQGPGFLNENVTGLYSEFVTSEKCLKMKGMERIQTCDYFRNLKKDCVGACVDLIGRVNQRDKDHNTFISFDEDYLDLYTSFQCNREYAKERWDCMVEYYRNAKCDEVFNGGKNEFSFGFELANMLYSTGSELMEEASTCEMCQSFPKQGWFQDNNSGLIEYCKDNDPKDFDCKLIRDNPELGCSATRETTMKNNPRMSYCYLRIKAGSKMMELCPKTVLECQAVRLTSNRPQVNERITCSTWSEIEELNPTPSQAEIERLSSALGFDLPTALLPVTPDCPNFQGPDCMRPGPWVPDDLKSAIEEAILMAITYGGDPYENYFQHNFTAKADPRLLRPEFASGPAPGAAVVGQQSPAPAPEGAVFTKLGGCLFMCANGELSKSENVLNDDKKMCLPYPEINVVMGKALVYEGCLSTTLSGRTCKPWSQVPGYQNDPKLNTHNFCRNPDGSQNLWCYTTDPSMEKDACASPHWGQEEFKQYHLRQVNNPRLATVYPPSQVTGKNSQCPNNEDIQAKYSQGGHASDGHHRRLHENTGNVIKYELKEGSIGTATDYKGCLSKTLTGRTCRRWDQPKNADQVSMPAGDRDYCRNPGGKYETLWCYTNHPDMEWDLCAHPDWTPEQFTQYVASLNK